MAPILGIWASSKATTAADTGAMFPLQVITVGPAGASSVTFTNIPGTYAHLQIRCITRGTTSGGYGLNLKLNNDSGSNYGPSHYLEGTGASAISGIALSNSTTKMEFYATARSDTTASVFSAFIIDLLDYVNTNKYKTVRHFGGFDANGSGYIDLDSGLWMSTSAVTQIDLTTTAGNFVQYSQFALYGIKGA